MDRLTPQSLAVRSSRESDSMSNRSRKSFSTTSITESQYSYEQYRGCTFNPNTRQGRRFYVIQMLILHLIPVMALIIQNGYTMGSAVYRQQRMLFLTRTIEETADIGLLLSSMQMERSEVTHHVFGGNNSTPRTAEDSPATERDSSTFYRGHTDRLKHVFERTDLALERLVDWRAIASQANLQWHDRMFASKGRFQTYLGDLRRAVLERRDLTRAQLRWYDRTTSLLLRVLVRHITGRKLSSGDISSPFLAYINIMRAIEHLGLLLSLGLRYLTTGLVSPRLLVRAALSDTLFWEYIGNTRTFASRISDNLTDTLNGEEMGAFMIVRDGIISNTTASSLGVSTSEYFRDSSFLLDRLRKVQLQLKNTIESATGEEMAASQRQQMWTVGLLVLILTMSLIGILMTRNIAVEMESFTESLSAKTAEVRRERRRADRLLCQMLPASVALQLKSMHKVSAESFKAVTVLFSDIVDFSIIASDSTPIQVMAFLNRLFKMFDNRIDRFDVYKVEAVETVYMCASGLPHKNGDRHVTEVADLALELLASAYRFEIPHLPDRPLQVRLGVNTGPCVAGVVGTKMPRYCLFGDTINTAARMEHTGLLSINQGVAKLIFLKLRSRWNPTYLDLQDFSIISMSMKLILQAALNPAMKIHLTERTRGLLQHMGGYLIEFRGHIQVEGKGTMDTYWLVGKLDEVPSRNVGISISDE